MFKNWRYKSYNIYVVIETILTHYNDFVNGLTETFLCGMIFHSNE